MLGFIGFTTVRIIIRPNAVMPTTYLSTYISTKYLQVLLLMYFWEAVL